jgi:hypothetical protein
MQKKEWICMLKKPLHGKLFAAFFLILVLPAFMLYGCVTAKLEGTGMRIWGSEFELSSGAEFKRGGNAGLNGGDIIVDDTVGDGAIKLAPGIAEAVYETVIFDVPAFNKLVMSWNADTQDGTWVEVLARSSADGASWSTWTSWGKWSPFSQDFAQGIRCSSSGGNISTDEYTLGGSKIQLRAVLHRDSPDIASPVLRLLHGTLKNTSGKTIAKEYPEAEFPGGGSKSFATINAVDNYIKKQSPQSLDGGKGIYIGGIPQYSQQLRGPVEGGVICSVTSIAMLINGLSANEKTPFNRLVEEIGLASFDYGYNGYGNWSYTVAQAGAFGFRAHVEYSDQINAETIKRHLLSGHALAMSVTYSTSPGAANYLRGAQGATAGHLITVLGVVWRDGVEYIISHDSWAGNSTDANELVYREYRMEQFLNVLKSSSGALYVVKPGIEKGAGNAAPKRVDGILREVSLGSFELCDASGKAVKIDASQRPRPNGYIAYIAGQEEFLGKNPTRYSYVPLGADIKLADNVPESADFKMYVIMGNGYTYYIDRSRVELSGSLAALASGLYSINNSAGFIGPGKESIEIGALTVGEFKNGLKAARNGQLKIFAASDRIAAAEDFEKTTARPDTARLAADDSVFVVASDGKTFKKYTIITALIEQPAGIAFENCSAGALLTLTMADFPYSNRLKAYSGEGKVTYTVTSGNAVRVVENDPESFYPQNPESGLLMPFLTNETAIVTATLESDGIYKGTEVSYSVIVRGGSQGEAIRRFTWGTFEGPSIGRTVQNNLITNGVPVNGPFPYLPHPDDPPYFWFGVYWNGATGDTGTKVQWYKNSVSFSNRLENNTPFEPGEVYAAEIILDLNEAPGNAYNYWFYPSDGAAFRSFADSINGLPAAGKNGVQSCSVTRGNNYRMTVVIIYDKLI